jgi:hypothetical protein
LLDFTRAQGPPMTDDRLPLAELLAKAGVGLPPGSGGMGSEGHAALSMVIPSMLALASKGVR